VRRDRQRPRRASRLVPRQCDAALELRAPGVQGGGLTQLPLANLGRRSRRSGACRRCLSRSEARLEPANPSRACRLPANPPANPPRCPEIANGALGRRRRAVSVALVGSELAALHALEALLGWDRVHHRREVGQHGVPHAKVSGSALVAARRAFPDSFDDRTVSARRQGSPALRLKARRQL